MKSFNVRAKGLEPSHREALDPKSSVSTNFTTPAKFRIANIIIFTNWQSKIHKILVVFNKNL